MRSFRAEQLAGQDLQGEDHNIKVKGQIVKMALTVRLMCPEYMNSCHLYFLSNDLDNIFAVKINFYVKKLNH